MDPILVRTLLTLVSLVMGGGSALGVANNIVSAEGVALLSTLCTGFLAWAHLDQPQAEWAKRAMLVAGGLLFVASLGGSQFGVPLGWCAVLGTAAGVLLGKAGVQVPGAAESKK